MRRFFALAGSIALIVLVAATAAMAARSGRAPGVREAQTSVCPASTKPSDDTKNENSQGGGGTNGQGGGGTNGQGNSGAGTTTETTDTDTKGNGGGNGNGSGGNGGGADNNNAGGNGNGNGDANGHGNGQRGGDDCVAAPSHPNGVAGDGNLPPARAGRSVNVEPTDGTVRVKQPDAEGFTPLAESAQLPQGTVIDARNGSLELTSAGTGADGQQTAAFTGAKFQVRQEKSKAAVTELVLRGGAFKGCPRLDHGRRAAAIRNGFIASRSKARRRLFGSGRGRFRTRGRWGSATVRGTTWKVEDTCGGTLTTVVRGVVEVADFGKKKTVRVRAGEEYFSRVRR